MTRGTRLWRNLVAEWWGLQRHFPRRLLQRIAAAVQAGEATHLGEICFAVQSRLSWLDVLRGVDARRQAHGAFAHLRVWDTELNSGVLIYVLLAEHRIEVVADRGIAAKVAPGAWDAVCAVMRQHYLAGDWAGGSLAGVAAVNALLVRHLPAAGHANPDELPNRPVIL